MRPNQFVLTANKGVEKDWLSRLARSVRDNDVQRSEIELLASSHRDGKSCRVVQRIIGAFNYCFRIRFDEDCEQWILRFPIPGDTMSPSRKVQVELATMRFIYDLTEVPVPKVVASGEFYGLGPYIIMEFIQGHSLDDLILDDKGKLRQDIPETKIRHIYRQLAKIHLQLASHSFDKIGALAMTDSETGSKWFVESGPLTFKSNEIERMGGVKSEEFSGQPYRSTIAYVHALLDQSLRHLQDNPMASKDEQEARDDYEAIHTLKAAVPSFYAADTDECLLFNDDFRFGNMLVDEDFNIRAMLDWEFCYVAPASFLKSPPCWLIGLDPFEWDEDDHQEYNKRLGTYFELLEEEENIRHRNHNLSTSIRMCRDDGTFWFNLAVREPFPLRPIMRHCWKLGAIRDVPRLDDNDDFGRKKMDQRLEYEQSMSGNLKRSCFTHDKETHV